MAGVLIAQKTSEVFAIRNELVGQLEAHHPRTLHRNPPVNTCTDSVSYIIDDMRKVKCDLTPQAPCRAFVTGRCIDSRRCCVTSNTAHIMISTSHSLRRPRPRTTQLQPWQPQSTSSRPASPSKSDLFSSISRCALISHFFSRYSRSRRARLVATRRPSRAT